VPVPSAVEVEVAIEQIRIHKSPGTGKIPAELITAGGRTIRPEIHKLTKSAWNKEGLPEEWKESILVPVYKKGDNPAAYNFCQQRTKFYPASCCQR
jgi:hypothetical protein